MFYKREYVHKKLKLSLQNLQYLVHLPSSSARLRACDLYFVPFQKRAIQFRLFPIEYALGGSRSAPKQVSIAQGYFDKGHEFL